MAGARPRTISGRRPPGEALISAPICDSGSMTRPIGRPDRLASPINVVVIGWLATSPMSRRVEVPLFPMSSASRGWSSPPTPTPWMRHSPSSWRSIVAPIARIAAAVASTSCPSSSPVTRLSPTASAESISERCEMLLSPGIAIHPLSGTEAEKLRGVAV